MSSPEPVRLIPAEYDYDKEARAEAIREDREEQIWRFDDDEEEQE